MLPIFLWLQCYDIGMYHFIRKEFWSQSFSSTVLCTVESLQNSDSSSLAFYLEIAIYFQFFCVVQKSSVWLQKTAILCVCCGCRRVFNLIF